MICEGLATVNTRAPAKVQIPLVYSNEREELTTLPKAILMPAMPSLLLLVFFLQLAIHLVNTVGASAVNSLV
jgi:hypothetical protein